MRTPAGIILALLLAVPLFSQSQSQNSADRPKLPAANPMQISQYMPESGLTYLELLDKAFDQAVEDHLAYSRAMARHDDSFLNMPTGGNIEDTIYGKEIGHLEERIEINVRSEGDKKFLEFLQNTKAIASTAYINVLREDPTYNKLRPHPAIAKLYPVCVGQAHAIVLSGIFSYGDCSSSDYDKALQADDPEAFARMQKMIADSKKKP